MHRDCSQNQEQTIMRIVEKLKAVRLAKIQFESEALTI
jgi:hypothetical protein